MNFIKKRSICVALVNEDDVHARMRLVVKITNVAMYRKLICVNIPAQILYKLKYTIRITLKRVMTFIIY